MACAKPFLRRVRRKGVDLFIPVPCGYCAACRRDKIRMWQDRLCFEAVGKPSTFLTLTYDDAHLPEDKSVHLEDWQRFHDRLRHCKGVPKYKFFCTSEYGSVNFRPHMHVCLINFDWQRFELYKAIDHAWEGKGFFDCSTLNPARIRYALKYMAKELVGDYKNEYELRGLKPLFHTMSKGIGRDWFFAHKEQLKAQKGYFLDGKLRPLPRYWRDLILGEEDLTNHDFVERFDKWFRRSADVTEYEHWNSYRLPLFDEFRLADDARLSRLYRQELLDFKKIVQ